MLHSNLSPPPRFIIIKFTLSSVCNLVKGQCSQKIVVMTAVVNDRTVYMQIVTVKYIERSLVNVIPQCIPCGG